MNLIKLKDMDISFYENNSEYMQFLKTCKLQAESYYSKLDKDKCNFKDELIDCYFQMERGKQTNNLNLFFTNIHKQIEILINSSILDIITINKLKSDLDNKKIKNYNKEEKFLWESGVFYIKDGTSREYEKFKTNPIISNLSFTSKINIFYVYFIGGSFSDNTLRIKSLNFKITNNINDLRNYFNHGNYQGSEKQMKIISTVKKENDDNLMWFYLNSSDKCNFF